VSEARFTGRFVQWRAAALLVAGLTLLAAAPAPSALSPSAAPRALPGAPASGPPAGRSSTQAGGASAVPARPDDRTIVHVLNRLGYGPRPGDVERVRAVGLAAYIEQQLHPERIDDRAVEARLARLETLRLSSREIAERFYLPLLEERRRRRERNDTDDAARSSRSEAAAAGTLRRGRPQGAEAAGPMRDPAVPRGEVAQPEQPGRDRPDPAMAELLRLSRQPIAELVEQKLLRAVYSERQLFEVMVDFWFNHFNVSATKGPARVFLTEYERDAIRPHALGRFRDLLGAAAKSPAMLIYLDNWMSVDPERAAALERRATVFGRFLGPRRPGQAAPAARRARGLNENYARELLELHTLGVDGGYTQADVVEVARAFTGWTIAAPRAGGGFRFVEALHDPRPKTVLGRRIDAGGVRDGEAVLDLLASHPSTARFIATKLARRFVADDPPASLVERAAARFRETGGDIREVVRTIVTSPEFFAPAAYRAKVKTPFEFVASALRATGAEVGRALAAARALQALGMPPYQCQPPTGYADTADAWVSAGAMVTRMNFATALAAGRLPDTTVPIDALAAGTSAEDRERVLRSLLGGDAGEATRAALARAARPGELVALALGSPEFQRR
jgi:uncharacterized protein (DUF1800 family)